MKTFKELLIELRACSEAREWAEDKTIEQVVEQCHRGDWLLWLARKVDIGLQPLTLAKGYCSNLVRHLMKDERSINAVDAAIAFGEGKLSKEDLDAAYTAAYAVTPVTVDAAFSAAYAASFASFAAAAAAYAAQPSASAYAAEASADAAAYANCDAAAYANCDAGVLPEQKRDLIAAVCATKKENQIQTANICRKYIGDLIIDKVNELLNTEDDTER